MLSRRIIALATTLLLHGAVLVVLLLLTIGYIPPEAAKPKELTLIPVGVFGREPAMGGGSGSEKIDPAPPREEQREATPEPKSKPAPAEETLTNPQSEAPAITKPSKTPEQIAAEKEAERKRQEEQQRQAIDSRITGAFGRNHAEGTKGGTGKGEGANNAVGSGFSLEGRSIVGSGGYPVRPEGFPPTRGTVVVRIVVNSEGVVTQASTRLRGTNVTNQATIEAALRAARKTRFNTAPGTSEQEGSITYHFDVQ